MKSCLDEALVANTYQPLRTVVTHSCLIPHIASWVKEHHAHYFQLR